MPGLIQRVPLGLIDFLGLQSSGGNPTVLPDQLSSILDLTPFYLANRWEALQTTTAAISTLGATVVSVLTVPAGQIWYCDQFQIAGSTNVTAATAIRVKLGVIDVQTTGIIAMSPNSVSGAAGERLSLGFGRELIMQANQAPCVYVESVTGAPAVQVDVSLRFARLRV